MDVAEQETAPVANIATGNSTMPRAVHESFIEDDIPRPDDQGIAEPQLPCQVRSMSMPIIETLGKIPTVASANAEVPHKSKDRHELRLPSFKALGIAVPHPDQLLTPPAETDQIAWHPLSQPLPHRQDYENPWNITRPAERMTPEDDQTMSVPLDSENVDTGSGVTSVPQIVEPEDEDATMHHNSSSSEGESTGEPMWFEHAVDAVGKSLKARVRDLLCTS